MIKIKYEQLFPTASFLNCRIGYEIEVLNESHRASAEAQLFQWANEFHQKEFPQFYKEGKPTYAYTGEEEMPIIQKEKKPSGFDHWITEIQKTTTVDGIDGLEGLRLIADSNPKLKKVFDEQMKKLKA